jgi:hypothetical protein
MKTLPPISLVVMAVIALLMLVGASTTTATVLCKTTTSPCTSAYPKGTELHAKLAEGTTAIVEVGGLTEDTCTSSTFKGETENDGSSTETVKAPLTTLTFTGCSNTTKVIKPGSLEVAYSEKGAGTVTSKSAEVTVVAFGFISCILKTGEGTKLGTLDEPASSESDTVLTVSATIPLSGAGCPKGGATLTADYTVTAPKPLYLSPEQVTKAAGSALCKTTANFCTSVYTKGTAISTELVKSTSITLEVGASIEDKCSESLLTGETENIGDSTEAVRATLANLTFGGCTSTTKVLYPGSLEVFSSGKGTGIIASKEAEITIVAFGFISCILKAGKGTDLGLLDEPATSESDTVLTVNAPIPLEGGGCPATATLTAEYTVTAPKPLYVASSRPPGSVLCKSTNDPCGSAYSKGTALSAELKSSPLLEVNGLVADKCTKSTWKGESENQGSATETVMVSLSVLSLENCTNLTKVLKPGSMELNYTSKGAGTVISKGAEVTVEILFAGLRCILKTGEGTKLGTLDEPASSESDTVLTVNATIPLVGAGCPATATLTAEYTVTAPKPLYVAGS